VPTIRLSKLNRIQEQIEILFITMVLGVHQQTFKNLIIVSLIYTQVKSYIKLKTDVLNVWQMARKEYLNVM
jgi:hypothetical protein